MKSVCGVCDAGVSISDSYCPDCGVLFDASSVSSKQIDKLAENAFGSDEYERLSGKLGEFSKKVMSILNAGKQKYQYIKVFDKEPNVISSLDMYFLVPYSGMLVPVSIVGDSLKYNGDRWDGDIFVTLFGGSKDGAYDDELNVPYKELDVFLNNMLDQYSYDDE